MHKMNKEQAIYGINRILSLIDTSDFYSYKNRFEFLQHPKQLEEAFRFIQQMKKYRISELSLYQEKSGPRSDESHYYYWNNLFSFGCYFFEYSNDDYETEGMEVQYHIKPDSVSVSMHRDGGEIESFVIRLQEKCKCWLCIYSREISGKTLASYKWQITFDRKLYELDSI